ncbi:LuxR C-terminal-related transcriptional regulator [Paenibacillus xanthanilyticus]|uniref:LuxR C-terminal-related transcriptional regulator n=1 Tax=Paenibacillus xanthanilyticus TaxID=1783531 RepID=A0ABV8KBG0_9BACL
MNVDGMRWEEGAGMPGWVAEVAFEEKEEAYLVGRQEERARFERYLRGESDEKRVWSLYGTGGVGKSTLLDAFRRQARRQGAAFYLLDSRDFVHTGGSFCRKLLEQMRLSEEPDGGDEAALRVAVDGLNKLARERRVIIAIDTFEEMGLLQEWLRDQWLRKLSPGILVVLAGRYPLKGPWLLSPAWRERTSWMPLGHLERADVFDYARRCGIASADQAAYLWERTQGHGLSLALAVSSALLGAEGPIEQSGWSAELASLWLKEVPDDGLRTLVEAASLMRLFNQELLAFVTEQDVDDAAFNRLTELSFVRKSVKGWRLHDLMRESTRGQLRERFPGKYRKLRTRCVSYYAEVIRDDYRKRDVAAEVGELFYYIGDETIRASLNVPRTESCAWEPLTAETLEVGLRYLERRRAEAAPVHRRGIDPETGALLEVHLTREEMLYTIAGLNLEELLALGSDGVLLLRTPAGDVCGVSAIIPIESRTLAYLEQDAFAGPYFRHLTPEARRALDVTGPEPAGWFIKSIDILDWNDPVLVAEAVTRMHGLMCAGKLFVTSPPPLAMFRQSHLGLGFELLPHVAHCAYDGKTPTPTFVLDTRGEGLERFLAEMLRRIGVELRAGEGEYPHGAGRKAGSPDDLERRLEAFGLTEREREAARLVLEDCSNAEIAARMFVSEITVKKHLSSAYAKAGVKNRAQLIRSVLQR